MTPQGEVHLGQKMPLLRELLGAREKTVALGGNWSHVHLWFIPAWAGGTGPRDHFF